LEVELGGVELALVVADHGNGRVRGSAEHLEAGRQRSDAVAVAHPHRILLALAPDALEQRALGRNLNLGATELAMVTAFDLAAQLQGHGLLAVANADRKSVV